MLKVARSPDYSAPRPSFQGKDPSGGLISVRKAGAQLVLQDAMCVTLLLTNLSPLRGLGSCPRTKPCMEKNYSTEESFGYYSSEQILDEDIQY